MIGAWFHRRLNRLHPGQLILLSYLTCIVLGAALLLLPAASRTGGLSWLDAVFIATSAVCVTGLSVLNISESLTGLGQGIVLLLCQIGGLGIMTFSVVIFRLLGRQISFRGRLAVRDLYAHMPHEDFSRLLKAIFVFTFAVEALGVLLLWLYWLGEFPVDRALYLAVFHSVSAFTNAGFTVFEHGLAPYRADWLINGVLAGLIILGGIGFPVVYDLYEAVSQWGKARVKLLAQTKIVLVTSAILLTVGAVLFAALEWDNVLRGMTWSEAGLVAVFQSVSARSGGLSTIDVGMLTDPTLAMLLFLMFVGGGPGSCAGGVRVTALALVVAYGWSRLRHERRLNLFKKSISTETLIKTVVLIFLSLMLILLIFFAMLLSEPQDAGLVASGDTLFIRYLFETVSAFGTTGLSMGVTSELTPMGKFWIILMMLVGRVGVLTMAYAVVGSSGQKGVEYAEEPIMVG